MQQMVYIEAFMATVKRGLTQLVHNHLFFFFTVMINTGSNESWVTEICTAKVPWFFLLTYCVLSLLLERQESLELH